MNYKIKVKYNYIYANPMKDTVYVAELLDSHDRAREMRLEAWIETDSEYDPLNMFQITKLEFDKNGKAKYIEMTEGAFT